MALVSVTEAARLTGKNRATIHRYIKQGKLSQISDATNTKKVDTSELIRVFGSLTATHATP
ncbi:TPA: helix-turn-helix domain-containing protein, partial [Escherichia coli]